MTPSERSVELQARLIAFFEQHIYPNEHAYAEQLAAAPHRFATRTSSTTTA